MTEGEKRFSGLTTESTLVRVYPKVHDPLWFGPAPDEPPLHRFDAPDGSYGVCYMAHEPAGAFVETFLRDPERAGPAGTSLPGSLWPTEKRVRILAASELEAHAYVQVKVLEPLQLARLHGRGLSWHGVTASVSSTSLYRETQELSGLIHADPSRPDGIEYRCRHDNSEMAVALFDRGEDRIAVVPGSESPCLELAVTLQEDYPFVIDHRE